MILWFKSLLISFVNL